MEKKKDYICITEMAFESLKYFYQGLKTSFPTLSVDRDVQVKVKVRVKVRVILKVKVS